jgi:hypothetical protein
MALATPESVFRVDFDAQQDVLYVNLGAPMASYADERPAERDPPATVQRKQSAERRHCV